MTAIDDAVFEYLDLGNFWNQKKKKKSVKKKINYTSKK